MALVDELAKLRDVQRVDRDIYQREQALAALDSGEQLKKQAIDIMKRFDAATATLHAQQGEQRDRELELKSLEQKRAVVHDKLYGGRITNPKELGDLQKDEEMIAGQIDRLEEVLLELMDRVETATAEHTEQEKTLDTAKRRWRETVTRSQAETARLQQEIAVLKPERERLAAVVEKPLLRRYDEIRRARAGVGMAATQSDTCPACHIKLTPQTMEKLREGEELVFCDNCGRIMAWLA